MQLSSPNPSILPLAAEPISFVGNCVQVHQTTKKPKTGNCATRVFKKTQQNKTWTPAHPPLLY